MCYLHLLSTHQYDANVGIVYFNVLYKELVIIVCITARTC